MIYIFKPTVIIALFTMIVCGCGPQTDKSDNFTILCSTFPIYQLTRNITRDIPGVETQLLLAAQLGCPHDYALTPQDMQKVANADILVINGLGLEQFLGAPIERVNKSLEIVDSSHQIEGILFNQDKHTEASAECKTETHTHDCSSHASGSPNPHLFASPKTAADLVHSIAHQLGEKDPVRAKAYLKNSITYADKLLDLHEKLTSLKTKISNRKVIQPHGIFNYLARDLNLEIIAVLQPHGQEPSAAELLALTKIIQETKPAAVITEPQYPTKITQTLSRETGIKSFILDPAASGPEDADLDYYEQVMTKNIQTLAAELSK